MEILSIAIHAKEWFDRTYGNSYFSAQIIINDNLNSEKIIKLPFQNGYGRHYENAAHNTLLKEGLLPKEHLDYLKHIHLVQWCKMNGIPYTSMKQENCLKREVKAWGEE